MRLWRWLLSTVRTFYGQHVQGTNWLKNNVPEIEEGKRRDFLRAYLLKRNVRYLAIYGDWFSWIIEDSRLQKMF